MAPHISMATAYCAPAPTSLVRSSAPEPLLALGVEVPEAQSPGEHIIIRQYRRAARLPAADESQNIERTDEHQPAGWCAWLYGPPQAPLTVCTV